jgi:hypothetical protein
MIDVDERAFRGYLRRQDDVVVAYLFAGQRSLRKETLLLSSNLSMSLRAESSERGVFLSSGRVLFLSSGARCSVGWASANVVSQPPRPDSDGLATNRTRKVRAAPP